MTNQGQKDSAPTWSGDAAEFESYVTACKWYAKATKESERTLVVARLWSRLTGAARSVVKHLDPDQFEDKDGLARFLQVLRDSPLQQLSIPDAFGRLEKWNHLRRGDRESMSELPVREDELFTELQQALTRARMDKRTATSPSSSVPPMATPPPTAPPSRDAERGTPSTPTAGEASTRHPPPTTPPPTAPPSGSPMTGATDFFGDELRGYRLLKAARLTHSERQNVLVQTGNSTHFLAIRHALRTLYAEEMPGERQQRSGRVWWTGIDDWDDPYEDGSPWYGDGSPTSQDPYAEDPADQYWTDWHKLTRGTTMNSTSAAGKKKTKFSQMNQVTGQKKHSFGRLSRSLEKQTRHCSKREMRLEECARQEAIGRQSPPQAKA